MITATEVNEKAEHTIDSLPEQLLLPNGASTLHTCARTNDHAVLLTQPGKREKLYQQRTYDSINRPPNKLMQMRHISGGPTRFQPQSSLCCSRKGPKVLSSHPTRRKMAILPKTPARRIPRRRNASRPKRMQNLLPDGNAHEQRRSPVLFPPSFAEECLDPRGGPRMEQQQ